MPAPFPLLRSWLKEERRLLPERSLLLGVGSLTLVLLILLLVLEARRRNEVIRAALVEQRQERIELVTAALDDVRRTAFDWARWNDSYRFAAGRNPAFIRHDLAATSLFSSGGVMVLFDRQTRPLVSFGAEGAERPSHRALVGCARSNIAALRDLSSAVPLFCRDGKGKGFLGILTLISNNDSTAPPQGSLVMFEPLIPARGSRLREQLEALQAQMLLGGVAATEALPGPVRLFSDGRQPVRLQRQSTLPLLGQSLREDSLLLLVLLTPLLLARLRFTLAHRRQRLLSLRLERGATARIRQVCHQLDALLAELGLSGEQLSPQQRVMAALVGEVDAAPRPAPANGLALEGRLDRFVQRFQHVLSGARSLALLDSLTQLPNRRFFVEQLALQGSDEAGAQVRFALLFVDIDRFKAINDSFGHSTGDRVLIEVARRLRQLIGPRDFLARYGGDEFVILQALASTSWCDVQAARDDSLRFAERIASAFDGPLACDGLVIELSLSLGLTLVHPDLPHPEVAIQQCDMAMLQAKRNKHSRIAIFDLDRNDPHDSDYELYSDLLQAIRDHQLAMLFQPIVNGRGQLQGVEALARWAHPQRGPIPPDLFVSLAERHRQIHRLGDELLRQALQRFGTIQGGPVADLGLSINLSPSQLEDPSLVNRLLQQLDLQRLSPGRLTLELTERGILEASAVVSANLSLLREQGIRLSLDDFGTGQSSLSLLSQLQPDEVKIDRSFVAAMEHDPYADQIVTLLARMAPALGFALVAEGVEDQATLMRLQRLGIDRFQGYWFSRPLEAVAINGRLRLPAPTAP